MSIAKGTIRDLDDWLPALGGPPRAATPDDIPPVNILEWANRYRRIEGRAFTLKRFTPLTAIYEDDHKHICVMKPAQRGVSEFAINLACFALDIGATAWGTEKDGLNVAYIFPTQAALSDFSKERITGLKVESSHLAEMFKGSGFGGVTFKQVGASYLYLRGGWSESALLSFAADLLILDEYDRMDASARALARRRLAASPLARELDISTPTLPGLGIHQLYLQSDQMRYWQPCPNCGEEVVYEFLRDVTLDDLDFDGWKKMQPQEIRAAELVLHCPQCRKAVDDVARCLPGVWRPENPRVKNLRGYQVPALAFPMADLPRYALAAVSPDPTEQQEFWRSDMGLPHDASGSRVTEAMLQALDRELVGGALPADLTWRETTMGIDVGSRFHYRITGTDKDGVRVVRLMGAVSTWDDLTRLMLRYQVRRCVIDAQPELHAAREWAEQFPTRVVRAYYPASVPGGVLFKLASDTLTVNIARTMSMDAVYDTIASLEERWPTSICRDQEVIDHLTAPVRITILDAHGQEKIDWAHTKPDHLFHACVYDQTALRLLRAARLGDKLPILAQGSASGGWEGRR